MDKKQYNIWDWIYSLIFPISFIVIVTAFGIWVSGTMSRDNLFLAMLVPTILIVLLTILHLTNLTLKKLIAKRLFEASIPTTLLLILTSYIFVSWTNNLRPAPKLNCDFDLKSLTVDIDSKFKPDTIIIQTVVIQEEVYFPKLICPRIIIDNPTTRTIDFKTLNESQTRFDNYKEIESKLKDEGQFIADRISNSCNIGDYNDLIIEFVKIQKDKNGFDHRFIIHYNENAR
jgi:hypothetical protein